MLSHVVSVWCEMPMIQVFIVILHGRQDDVAQPGKIEAPPLFAQDGDIRFPVAASGEEGRSRPLGELLGHVEKASA